VENLDDLIEILRTERARQRMTLDELSEKADISPNALSKIERGEVKSPGMVTLINISAALGMKIRIVKV
jgi:transcriptional regulator with XRE-family HTH domain